MAKRYSVVLFDMDGTLTDTMRLQPYLIQKYLLSGSKKIKFIDIQRKMAAIYYRNHFTWFKPKTPFYFAKTFDISIFRMFRLSLLMAFQYWRAVKNERLFPMASTVISNLRDAGVQVGLVTNGKDFEVKLKIASILPLFNFQVTASDVSKKKPNPEMILSGIKKANSLPENTLYVGDTIVDMLAAKNAAVDFALVTTGTFGPEVVKIGAERPQNIFSDLKQLKDFILHK